ncbi:MAG: lipoyl(octanoyl) transferase LipB [Theionarchaea archaeon]|nr:lipoyl(octanoyl) transferase LipB [Theionarchaea archaeon]
MKREAFIFDLGLIDYEKAYTIQKTLTTLINRGDFPETLLLLEHPPVYTMGKSGSKNGLKIPVIEVDRGGDITFHGPGQLVGYPLVYVEDRKVSRYIQNLEESLIHLLKKYSIKGTIKKGYPGVWVGDEKIASIGVKIKDKVAYHGFALNVSVDLAAFHQIKPCGLDVTMTSMEKVLSKKIDMCHVKNDYKKAFEQQFNVELKPKNNDLLEEIVTKNAMKIKKERN